MWILAAALLLAPSTAQAQVWWDFIESLSGPGPFQGFGFYVRVACGTGGDVRRGLEIMWAHECFDDSRSDIRYVVEVRGLFPGSDDTRPRLLVSPADTRPVGIRKWDGVASYRVLPSLDVGAGGGAIKFTGEDVNEQWRPTIIPFSVTYTPLALADASHRYGRIFRIHLETVYIPFGFTGADWGQPGLSPTLYSTDGNWVLAGGLYIDLGTLLFKKP